MPSDFLAQLANLYSTRNFEATIADGRFSLLNRTSATIGVNEASTLVDMRLRTQFQILGKEKEVVYDDTFTDYSGYNRKFISDYGMFMPDTALSEFARTDFGRRVVTKDIEAKVNALPQRDCHVAFLYNMLISWFNAKLYEGATDRGVDDVGLKFFYLKYSGYSDSHCELDGVIPDGQRIRVELGCAMEVRTPFLRMRHAENYFDMPYVLHYDASSKGKESFYLLHYMGRSNVTALNYDVYIPPNDCNNTLLDRVNASTSYPACNEAELEWDDHATMWDWIIDYVRLNRLEQQFAAVFEAFSAMTFHPDFSTQEANVWHNAKLKLVLSPNSPTRARLRVNLTEEPYVTAVEAKDYVVSTSVSASNRMVNAAIYNYLMWYGLYALVHDEARNRTNWRTVFNSVANNLENLITPTMRSYCVANITGLDIDTFMSTGCGFYIDMSGMSDVHHLPVRVSKDASVGTTIPVNAVYAPVSGSLLLGAYAGNFEVVQHLKAIQTIEGRGIIANYSEVELLQIANIYRLAGNDVTLREERTDARIVPYSNVNECVIEPASVFFDPCSTKTWHLESSDPRGGRTYPMVQVKHVLDHNKLSIIIQKPNIEPVVYKSPQQPLEMTPAPRRRPLVQLVGKVLPKFTASAATFRARTIIPADKSGFRVDAPKVPPMRPEGTVVTTEPATGETEIMASAPVENLSTHAQSAEPNYYVPRLEELTLSTGAGSSRATANEETIPSTSQPASKAEKEKADS